ncbi:MAG TPA: TetR/AcrR family transcriptional regulator [Solirubrobacteraceae bacterium]|nr:TetR/AcrR family transcriptional regulator [Solirubrobacteraceae bacterium]
MSSAYELSGRTRQKARTRNALLAAARELLAEGANLTVDQAADRAEVSRSTAYRYFPNQRMLVAALHPEVDLPSLLDEPAPDDPRERLEVVIARFTDLVLRWEPEYRAQLRLSLEPGAADEQLPLRGGRGIRWIEDALAPLRGELPDAELRRLVLAIRATTGIESFVWLTDVARVPREEAVEILRGSARELLGAALARIASPG